MKSDNIPHRLIISFSCLILLLLGFGLFSLYNIRIVNSFTHKIYNHPMVILNTAHKTDIAIVKIQHIVNNIARCTSKSKIENAIKLIAIQDVEIQQYLNIIHDTILGDAGQVLASEMDQLFVDWKPLRQDVIDSSLNRDPSTQINFIEPLSDSLEKCLDHVALLETKLIEVMEYANEKASKFIDQSNANQNKFNILSIVFLFLSICISIIITIITLRKVYSSKVDIVKNEEMLALVIDTSPIGICIVDPDGIILKTNLAYENMLGYSKKELIGTTFYSLTYGPNITENQKLYREMYALKTSGFKMEKKYIKKNGELIDVHVSATIVKDASGKAQFATAFVKDITARKCAENELAHSRYLLTEAQRLMSIGSWVQYPDDGVLVWSDQTYHIFEIDKINFTGELFDVFTSRIHPDDVTMVLEAFNYSVLSKEPYEVDHRIVMSDGRIKYVKECCETTYDADGDVEKSMGTVQDITERKLLEIELQEKEDFITSVMDNLPIGVAVNSVDPSVDFSYMNDAFPLHYHTTRAELEKPDNFWEAVFEDPDYRKWIRAKVIADCESGDFNRMCWNDVEITKNENVIAYLNTRNTPFVDQQIMISTVVDVTELTKQKQFLDVILDEIPGMFAVYDSNKNIIKRNRKHQSTTGYTDEEYETLRASDFIVSEDSEITNKVFDIDFLKKVVNLRLDVKTKDGRLIPHEYSIIPFNWSDEKLIMVIGIDISDQFEAVKEKERLELRLQQAQKMEAIGTLAGGIAHDFNNILTIILGYTEMIQGDIIKAQVECSDACKSKGVETDDNLKIILDAADKAKNLVRRILTFSRQAEANRVKMKCIDGLDRAIELIRPTLPSTIDIVTDTNCDASIYADETQFQQIIMNLCINSFHAMEDTGGQLSIGLYRVALTDDDLLSEDDVESGEFVKLSIRDTGIGIPKDVRDQIFNPYFTTKSVDKGTGMGLSIVHGIIKQYGGFINVYSEIGTGTVFNIFIPVSNGHVPHVVAIETDDLVGTERILLIDDEELIINVNKMLLESFGYRVDIQTNPVEALFEFKRNPDTYDIIITDQTMPSMTGFELAVAMIAIREDIPIILCSGYSSVLSDEKICESGIREFALKPILKNDLAKLIRKVLSNGNPKQQDA